MNTHKDIARSKAIQAGLKAKAAAAMPLSNRKLADRMADAKRTMDAARAVYDVLRDQVIAAGGDVGDEYLAKVSVQTTSRVDRKKLEARFGKQAVAECYSTSTTHRVTVSARKVDVFD